MLRRRPWTALAEWVHRRAKLCRKPGTCAQRWKAIVTAINKDPYARGRVIFDILNEPDAYGLRWEVSQNPHVPSITTNYLRFMDMASNINHSALLAVNPTMLIVSAAPVLPCHCCTRF